ncbi:MAG: hypothetical protein M3046_02170, partial [Actinomycetota bacterium]|nr:hypothetical protein [Actinomycetota bacterium]
RSVVGAALAASGAGAGAVAGADTADGAGADRAADDDDELSTRGCGGYGAGWGSQRMPDSERCASNQRQAA